MPAGPAPSAAEALKIAESVFGDRYAGASLGFAAGSIMRGEGTLLSDIDLVVVYEALETAHRESFVTDGVPVEAFVHDPGTLAWFLDQDVARGRPSILNMIAEGVVLGDDAAAAEDLRSEVRRRLAMGPPPLLRAALDALRYEITDAIDDLRGDRRPEELLAIGAMLHPKLVELALRGRGRWSGSGKWAPRLVAEFDPDLARMFDLAFRSLFVSNDARAVIDLAEGELAPYGGPLFDGDRRVAPAAWRI